MPCSSCGCYIDEPSWHPCEKKCIKWSETDHTWIAELHDGTIVRCSWSYIDDSFWFFYCPKCKRDTSIRCLRRAKIVVVKSHFCCSTDYITDSSDDTDSDDSKPKDSTPTLTSVTSNLQVQKVKVTLRKASGEIWVETKPLSVYCTMSCIVFDVARVDRRNSVVPYLMYDEKVQPYWKSLGEFPAVRGGCQALEMLVVFQQIETLIAILYDRIGPLSKDDMSYEAFKNCITDHTDTRYMDMETLMNTVYPIGPTSRFFLRRL